MCISSEARMWFRTIQGTHTAPYFHMSSCVGELFPFLIWIFRTIQGTQTVPYFNMSSCVGELLPFLIWIFRTIQGTHTVPYFHMSSCVGELFPFLIWIHVLWYWGQFRNTFCPLLQYVQLCWWVIPLSNMNPWVAELRTIQGSHTAPYFHMSNCVGELLPFLIWIYELQYWGQFREHILPPTSICQAVLVSYSPF